MISPPSAGIPSRHKSPYTGRGRTLPPPLSCVDGRKAAQGGYAYGAPPYGRRAHQKARTPEEAEQAGRSPARQLRDEAELSYREIAAVLEAEGIRPKRGERWPPGDRPADAREPHGHPADAVPAIWEGMRPAPQRRRVLGPGLSLFGVWAVSFLVSAKTIKWAGQRLP